MADTYQLLSGKPSLMTGKPKNDGSRSIGKLPPPVYDSNNQTYNYLQPIERDYSPESVEVKLSYAVFLY